MNRLVKCVTKKELKKSQTLFVKCKNIASSFIFFYPLLMTAQKCFSSDFAQQLTNKLLCTMNLLQNALAAFCSTFVQLNC